jgi:hypothetical protein
LARHWALLHSARVLSGFKVTECGGEMVKHSVDVRELGPKLSSISQLMFPDGDRNSALLAVWGASVPVVDEVTEVVLVDVGPELVVDVGPELVVDEAGGIDGDGLLEHAASATTQTGRKSTRSGHVRSPLCIGRGYRRSRLTWVTARR